MINVSNEFRTLMQTDTSFKQNAVITTVDGQTIELTEANFTVENNSVTDAAGANALPLGSAIARTIQIELMNDTGLLEDVALIGAKIRLYLTFQLSETVEEIEYGTFTVIEPETYGETVIISAIDNMYKADKEYTTGLTFPQTAGAVFRDVCDSCGLSFVSSGFANNDYIIQKKPEGLTCREVIGYIAQIAGGNARVNRLGSVEVITYDLSEIEVGENLSTNGGTFNPWTSGDTLSGGTFNPWTVGEVISGGTFVPWTTDSDGSGGALIPEGVHELRRWINLKVDTDDIVITGIQTIKRTEDAEGNTTESTIMYGSDGYVLVIDNPLIEGNEDNAIQGIGDILIGGRIRKFSGDHVAYPLAEFCDKAVIFDRKGNWYQTVLTDINFQFFGMTTLSNSAESALRNSSKYNSAAAQAVIAAKQLVEREKNARELAVEKLNQTLATSSGMYSTEENQPDGSTIYYLHDKPTIAESQNVMKLTAEAIGFSTDGGETYPFGFTLNGEMVMSIIATEGLNADWITTGALTVKNLSGKVVFQADITTGIVTINSKNFQLDANGNMTAANGKFSGEITSESGTIGGFTIGASTLSSDGGWGIMLNSLAGTVSAGAVTMSGSGADMGSIGITHSTGGSYISFREDSAATYGLTLYAATGKKIRLYSDTYFAGAAQFSQMPTFPSAIPISAGGTGATSAAAARNNLGVKMMASNRGTVNVPGGGYSDITISYGRTFSLVPDVALSVRHNSNNRVTAQLLDEPGLSSCTVRVFSDASGSMNVPVTVIAVGS